MITSAERFSKDSIRKGEIPDLKGKFVELHFGHARARGIVEQQDGVALRITDLDAEFGKIPPAMKLDWDSFEEGIAVG